MVHRMLRPLWYLSAQRWVWAGMAIGLTVGAGWQATQMLLEVPELPNCWAMYLSSHSASARLYCAEMIAGKRTIEDLQRAIKLVNELSEEDSLKEKGDRLAEEWSRELLVLGEEAFQQGNLEWAIRAANSVSSSHQSFQQAHKLKQNWQSVWNKAEAIYSEAEEKINQRKWAATQEIARELLRLGNEFWATTKYQELMQQLEIAQGNEGKPHSPQATARKVGKEEQSPVETYLARLKRNEEATIDAQLAKARNLARSGHLEGLKAAVMEAEQVLYSTARFEAVQREIDTWKRQIETIEDRPVLSRALALARKGDRDSLQAAIDEAYQIYPGRALYEEARQQIDQWSDRMYSLHAEEELPSIPATTLSPASLTESTSGNSSPSQAAGTVQEKSLLR